MNQKSSGPRIIYFAYELRTRTAACTCRHALSQSVTL